MMASFRWAILLLVPSFFALLSVFMGRDANWDFLNYRWYNAYALLNNRLQFDVLIANHATFYNPLLELPFYLIATHTPAIIAGFFVAFCAAVSFVPLFLITETVLNIDNAKTRLAFSTLVGLAGLLGGGVWGQIGIVSWDVALGSLTLTALFLLVKNEAAALQDNPWQMRARLLFSGVLVGSAAGLKLTAAIYPVGFAAALLFLPGPFKWRDRAIRPLIFSIGVGCGVILFGGYWMVRLYQAFGNPTFPYFNGIFHSPYAALGSNRDTTFLPKDIVTAIFFPVFFSKNSHYVAEYDFRDVHILLACLLLPLASIFAFVKRSSSPIVAPLVTRFLFIAFGMTYIIWEALFSIYRYVLPLEMLASLIIVVAIFSLPVSRKIQIISTLACLVICQLAVKVDFNRMAWGKNYVDVQLPSIIPENAMIFMVGGGPMGYVVPSLPSTVPVLRVGSALAKDNLFGAQIQQRIEGHKGPFLAIVPYEDKKDSTLSAYNLNIEQNACQPIISNSADPLLLCSVRHL